MNVLKNSRGEALRVTRQAFKGSDLVSIRWWFPKNGNLHASKRGVEFVTDALPEVIEALDVILREVADGGPPGPLVGLPGGEEDDDELDRQLDQVAEGMVA